MAKITLEQAASRLAERVSTLSETVRSTVYNKKAHILTVSDDLILEQIESQVGTRSFNKNKAELQDAVKTFCSSVFDSSNNEKNNFLARPSSSRTGFAVEILSLARISTTSNKNKFRILIVSLSGRGSSFDKAKTIKASAEKKLIQEINTLTGKSVKFDIGHINAVSKMQVEDAAYEFFSTIKKDTSNISIPASIRKMTSYKTLSKLSITADKRRKAQTKYLIALTSAFEDTRMGDVLKRLGDDAMLIAAVLEDSEINQRRGRSEERRDKNKVRKAVEDVVKQIDFTSTSSSLTDIEQIIEEIKYESISLIKGKVKGQKPKKPSNRGIYKTKDNIVETINNVVLQINSSSSSSPELSGINKDKQTTTNWLSLLPIINSKLTPRVIANMKYPSLVNRTGTFAQSAKVTNIETTREGFPSFVFDYDRDPYDVFDRTKGRSPWNTPERDPRALVDKSVREIVREMAISRFYTRRA